MNIISDIFNPLLKVVRIDDFNPVCMFVLILFLHRQTRFLTRARIDLV